MSPTPRTMETHPRLYLGSMAIILSILMRLAHPHGNVWHFAAGFLSGFGIVLLIADFVIRRRARV